jgi:hypothetical protein
MSGRIRFATIGLMAPSATGALTFTAGAATTVSSGNVKANSVRPTSPCGMGLARLLLIGRRRVFSAAGSSTSLTPFIRRRGWQ